MGRLTNLRGRLQGPAAKPNGSGWGAEHRGSASARGYGWAWQKAREETLREQGGLCQPCLRRGHTTPGCRIVDHIVNKARGGSDDKSNRQTICDDCHKLKTQAEARGEVWDESAADTRPG